MHGLTYCGKHLFFVFNMQISFELCISNNEQQLTDCCFFNFTSADVHCTRCTTYVIIIYIFLSFDFASFWILLGIRSFNFWISKTILGLGQVSSSIWFHWVFEVFIKINELLQYFVEIEWNMVWIRNWLLAQQEAWCSSEPHDLWLKIVGWKLLNAITITQRNLLLIYWTSAFSSDTEISIKNYMGLISICFANLWT